MPILTEIGQVEAMKEDGASVTFTPSFFNIAEIGSPEEIVSTYTELFLDKKAPLAAKVVLLSCAETDDDTKGAFIGWGDESGAIPTGEQVIIARQLMRHGIAGAEQKRTKSSGKFSTRFDPSEYIDSACFHFGLSQADAGKMTMTQFQRMLKMKYPELDESEKYPDKDAFDKAREAHLKRKAARDKKA